MYIYIYNIYRIKVYTQTYIVVFINVFLGFFIVYVHKIDTILILYEISLIIKFLFRQRNKKHFYIYNIQNTILYDMVFIYNFILYYLHIISYNLQ